LPAANDVGCANDVSCGNDVACAHFLGQTLHHCGESRNIISESEHHIAVRRYIIGTTGSLKEKV
jgi:hypothetical protein